MKHVLPYRLIWSRTAEVSCAEITTTGTLRYRRNCRKSSSPPIPGMRTSVITHSQVSLSGLSRNSSAQVASITSNPAPRRRSPNDSRRRSSSSTTHIRSRSGTEDCLLKTDLAFNVKDSPRLVKSTIYTPVYQLRTRQPFGMSFKVPTCPCNGGPSNFRHLRHSHNLHPPKRSGHEPIQRPHKL